MRGSWLVVPALLFWIPLTGQLTAQPVLLQIRPRVGDTLAMRLDHKVEMSGAPVGCVSSRQQPVQDSARGPQPKLCSDVTRRMTSVTEVFSRAIVRSVTSEGATVLAVTDSVRRGVGSGSAREPSPRRVAATNPPVELLVSTDGGAEVVDAGAPEELRQLFGQMPATLSRKAVAVGEKWVREMRLPVTTEAGAVGRITATFQLDSLGRNGDVAYISMRGRVSHDHSDGSGSEVSGWMTGSMQLDRRLAWITETKATIEVSSTVKPVAGGTPMRVRTRVTQTLRAGPAR